jgi:NAD(P)-dependent dehydrogenase (short-subunit alcohol dehydrogenase family)
MTGKRLEGRVALVTGAGNGIGQSCALRLAEHGALVVVNDLGTDEWAQGTTSEAADGTVSAIKEAGGVAVASYDSVATSEGCRRAVQTAVDAFGQVDIVVGCAGALIDGTMEATDEQYANFMALFTSQKFWLAREVVPGMVDRGYGRIITTTSKGATGELGQPVFAAAMGAVIGMTRGLAHEYAATGVTANCLSPGGATRLHATTHDLFKGLHEQGVVDDEFWESYLKVPPPAYVSPIVAWLCTEQARGVTGQVFDASGGRLGTWNRLEMQRAIYHGDHAAYPPWTMAELDDLVPRWLLQEP